MFTVRRLLIGAAALSVGAATLLGSGVLAGADTGSSPPPVGPKQAAQCLAQHGIDPASPPPQQAFEAAAKACGLPTPNPAKLAQDH
jgi:hypothetical protein